MRAKQWIGYHNPTTAAAALLLVFVISYGCKGSEPSPNQEGSTKTAVIPVEKPYVLPANHIPESITVDNQRRDYWYYHPRGKAKNDSLVIVLHGGGPGYREVIGYGWSELADKEGFDVIYPIGIHGVWKFYKPESPRDYNFLQALIAEAVRKYSRNPRHVYMTGFSMGAMMSHNFAAAYPELVAAIGPVAGTATTDEGIEADYRTIPRAPVPAIMLHGTADREIPYLEAPPSAELWAKIAGCKELETESVSGGGAYTLQHYEGGKDGIEVELYTLHELAHRWPKQLGNQRSIKVMWDFFRRYQSVPLDRPRSSRLAHAAQLTTEEAG